MRYLILSCVGAADSCKLRSPTPLAAMHDTIPKSDSLINSELNTRKVVNILRDYECCDFHPATFNTGKFYLNMNSNGESWRLSTSHLYATSKILCSQERLGRPETWTSPPSEPFKCKKSSDVPSERLKLFEFPKYWLNVEFKTPSHPVRAQSRSQSEFYFSGKLICLVRKQFVKAFPGWVDSPLASALRRVGNNNSNVRRWSFDPKSH